MKVKEFVEQYNKEQLENDKRKLLTKIVKRSYIPVREKIDLCEKICVATTTDSLGEYRIVSPARYILTMMTLIREYTNLELGEGKEIYTDYDELNESGLFLEVISSIPEQEYQEFNTLLSMVCEDYEINNYGTRAMIKGFVKMISDVLSGSTEKLTEVGENLLKEMNKSKNSQGENFKEVK